MERVDSGQGRNKTVQFWKWKKNLPQERLAEEEKREEMESNNGKRNVKKK